MSNRQIGRRLFQASAITLALVATGCSGESDSGTGGGIGISPPPPPPPPTSTLIDTPAKASHFLNQATFGPSAADVTAATGTDVSVWIVSEFAKPPTLYLPGLLIEANTLPRIFDLRPRAASDAFFDAAIGSSDQLRQRMVIALSEIIVVSNAASSGLDNRTVAIGRYMDILSINAFGNYRNLLDDITYSPAMAVYLTYLRNQKGNMATGQVPDENYARELLQLFSIGLVELNLDGSPKLDAQGQEIPTFDNTDITGLAKVFTGLSFDGSAFFDESNPNRYHIPLIPFDQFHSDLEKTFLGTTIPADTDATTSIDMALDTIYNHPNVAPFISRQLIQRFVTSAPQPAYIQRVATAFEAGSYTLPSGNSVGTGVRGDLSATIAAVLLDQNAFQDPASAPVGFGKIREPMLRLIHWARAFGVTSPDAADEAFLFDTSSPALFGQHPFRSPSVFNFFRPGYIAPATATGAAGLTAPELQIFNENSAIGAINILNAFIYDVSTNISGNPTGGLSPNYTPQLALADDAAALVDNLDIALTYGSLHAESRTRIINTINEISITTESAAQNRLERVRLAIAMVMTTPEYTVKR